MPPWQKSHRGDYSGTRTKARRLGHCSFVSNTAGEWTGKNSLNELLYNKWFNKGDKLNFLTRWASKRDPC